MLLSKIYLLKCYKYITFFYILYFFFENYNITIRKKIKIEAFCNNFILGVHKVCLSLFSPICFLLQCDTHFENNSK